MVLVNILYTDIPIVKIKNLIELEKRVSELDPKTLICIMTLGSLNRK